ncbi:glycosyltransferase family 2 protein [Blastococcus aurantiacus]|uniref:glycosyltransferase family 2 protein n=1 Tax=Blastococcus aurantiacus TaxID=1550231 RepID=UPI001C40A850|nr:glycosyltransferase family 2 protein [Blastococcus aurantiacus]
MQLASVGSSVRRALRRHIGIWPLFEARNRVVHVRGTLAARATEARETRRLAEQVRDFGPATVATVIPTYKRPDLLQRAVASALSQTVDDQIIIVVDDGGGLPKLPEDSRLRAVSLSHNTAILGLVRNVGISLTQSKYVAFLDDDNEWMPNHLEIALEALGRDVDMVYTALQRHLPDGTLVDILTRDFDRKALADDSNYLDINAVLVRRRPSLHFSRIPRTKRTLPKEDWEFIYRFSRRHDVRHVPVPTVRYLINEESYYTEWSP